MIRIAIDSNVLLYTAKLAKSEQDQQKVPIARELRSALQPRAMIVLPAQALGEVYTVLVRSGWIRGAAREQVADFARTAVVAPTFQATFATALDLAVAHQLQLWDAIILAAAAEASCELLLSEDMHAGFTWRGCTVANPFAATLDPRLQALLA